MKKHSIEANITHVPKPTAKKLINSNGDSFDRLVNDPRFKRQRDDTAAAAACRPFKRIPFGMNDLVAQFKHLDKQPLQRDSSLFDFARRVVRADSSMNIEYLHKHYEQWMADLLVKREWYRYEEPNPQGVQAAELAREFLRSVYGVNASDINFLAMPDMLAKYPNDLLWEFERKHLGQCFPIPRMQHVDFFPYGGSWS